jgi:hypothetical protein
MTQPACLARTIPAVLVIALVAGACGATSSPSPAASTPSGRPAMSPPAGQIEPTPSAVPVVGEVPEAILASARSLLADEIGIDRAATATVVVAEAVTWPDGSLGCPVPGQYYTQALVPGYRIVFAVDGVEYDFRASEAGYVRLCEPAGPRNP